jgi:hypothetical protein
MTVKPCDAGGRGDAGLVAASIAQPVSGSWRSHRDAVQEVHGGVAKRAVVMMLDLALTARDRRLVDSNNHEPRTRPSGGAWSVA